MSYKPKFGLFFIFDQDIHEGDGSVFHIVHDRVDLREDVVVEYLENDSGEQTEYGSQQGHLHTTGNNGRGDITCAFDIIECLNHTDYSTSETQHGAQSHEQADPAEVGLQFAHLTKSQ